MTSPIYTAIFDAIQIAIESAYYDDTTAIHDYARAATEAAMKACGPRELVWEWVNKYGVVEKSVTPHGIYSLHDDDDSAGGRMFVDFHLTDDGDCTKYAITVAEGYFEPDELQAAAQAHADAAHWENTVIGSETTK